MDPRNAHAKTGDDGRADDGLGEHTEATEATEALLDMPERFGALDEADARAEEGGP
jgi:hypothetical protein